MDKTNEEAIYARNKIRLELIPYLRDNYNTNIIDTMNRLSQIAKDDKSLEEILSFCHNIDFEVLNIISKDSLEMNDFDRSLILQNIQKLCKKYDVLKEY